VRFLAPFDPVVWDRRRFEHLWGWPYRFEAYTPAAKRQYGYYAMPLFVADRAVGWIQCSTAAGRLSISVQRVDGRPASKSFRQNVDREMSRMAAMLGLEPGAILLTP
jgi:uncharacterized protein